MKPCALAYCPTNEAGVLFLFGSLAVELGFMVTSLQVAFPDCQAMRRVEGGKWQPIWVEFEYRKPQFHETYARREGMRPDCVLGAQLARVPGGGAGVEGSGGALRFCRRLTQMNADLITPHSARRKSVPRLRRLES